MNDVFLILFLIIIIQQSCDAINQHLQPILFYDDFISYHYTSWRQEHPVISEPLIEPKFPWDADVHAHGTILFDELDAFHEFD